MKSFIVTKPSRYGGWDWMRVEAETASEAARKAGKAWGLPGNHVLSVQEGTDFYNQNLEGEGGGFYADGRPYTW